MAQMLAMKSSEIWCLFGRRDHAFHAPEGTAAGLPMMKTQVLFTPAADISGDGDSAISNDGRDLVKHDASLRSQKRFYLGSAETAQSRLASLHNLAIRVLLGL